VTPSCESNTSNKAVTPTPRAATPSSVDTGNRTRSRDPVVVGPDDRHADDARPGELRQQVFRQGDQPTRLFSNRVEYTSAGPDANTKGTSLQRARRSATGLRSDHRHQCGDTVGDGAPGRESRTRKRHTSAAPDQLQGRRRAALRCRWRAFGQVSDVVSLCGRPEPLASAGGARAAAIGLTNDPDRSWGVVVAVVAMTGRGTLAPFPRIADGAGGFKSTVRRASGSFLSPRRHTQPRGR
jgi:hypothetical protein